MAEVDFNFAGRTVLVTGAGQGLGRGICEKLAKSGARVIAIDRGQEKLDHLQEEFPKSVVPVCCDLDNWDATRDALKDIGPVDGIVNNAGVAFINSFFNITENDFDKSFNVNVKAIINVSQIAGKGMVERKKGAIVNISSQSSMKGHEDHAVYCSTKAAVDGLTRVMALELGRHNVRVNSVNPTVLNTPMGRNWWGEPSRGGPMLSRIPLGRFAEVEEVVTAVLFLLSDSSSMINGITLLVDGGHVGAPHRCSK